MKRRIDELVVSESAGGPATTPLGTSAGVFSSGARGPAVGASSTGGGSVVLGRQSHSPAPQLLSSLPQNPCLVTAGKTFTIYFPHN